MPDLSIIIVNFRGWERLSQCLDSLVVIHDSRFSHEVIIIDNSSNDGVVDKFRKIYPRFKFIINSGNLGFANGCNLGALNGKGAYFLFLNPDTIISADALFGMLTEVRSRSKYTIVSCCQRRGNGLEERPYGKFLSPLTLTGWLRALIRIVYLQRQTPFFQTENYIYPDWISGSVVMISRESFNGLERWDDDFWMYYEDVDLCRRALLKKGEIVYLRKICVEHNHGGASRINHHVTALTKTEVNISRHVYISKHEKGLRAIYMHKFLIVNNLLFGLIPAATGILLFFVPELRVVSHTYFQLVSYYLKVLKSGTWLSKRSANYGLKRGNQ